MKTDPPPTRGTPRRKHELAVCLLLLATFVSGCNKKAARVTVIPRATGPLMRDSFKAGVQAAALQKGGLSTAWETAPEDGDVQDQLGLFQEAAGGSAGIIFSPQETLAARSVVLQAIRDCTPVVIVDDEGFGPPPARIFPTCLTMSNREHASPQSAWRKICMGMEQSRL